MPMANVDPVAAQDSEKAALNEIEHAFGENGEGQKGPAKLVSPNGQELPLPDTLFEILLQVVQYLAHGSAVSVIPVHQEITTQEAADLLNVSRPHLIKLLEAGEIPFTQVGTHRRIRFDHLMAYKQKRDAHRKGGLDALTALSQEMGLYDA